jgi:hypothetical protein
LRTGYLDAVLTPDRVAAVSEAAAQPAAMNRDFRPVLCRAQWRHWLSQWGSGSTWIGVAAMVGAVVVGIGWATRVGSGAGFGRVSFAVWASGFAASALPVVLLLGMQSLYGAMYRGMGLVLTAFMGGLALGAWRARYAKGDARRVLGRTVLALALAGAVVPALLIGVSRLALGPGLGEPLLALFSFGLATLVGYGFPLAIRVAGGPGWATGAGLYGADLVGAAAGAMLTGSVLVPLWGLAGAAATVAVLNGLAGGLLLLGGRSGGNGCTN